MSGRLAYVRGHIAAEDYYTDSQTRREEPRRDPAGRPASEPHHLRRDRIQVGQPLGEFGETPVLGNDRLSFNPDSGSSQLNCTKANSFGPPLHCIICPFQKYAGEIYYCGYFKRISDVRQHIRRVHVQPPHCPTCRKTFKGDSDQKRLDDHIRRRQCEFALVPPCPGITLEKWEAIHKAASPKKTKRDEVQRWNEMRQILFPGTPPTSEIYVEMVGTGFSMRDQSSESLEDFLDFVQNPYGRIQAERARSMLHEGAGSGTGLAPQHSFSAQQATSSYVSPDPPLQPLARICQSLDPSILHQSLQGNAGFYMDGAPDLTMAPNDSAEQSSNVGTESYAQNPGFWSQT
ncbi:hypothetical protein DL769_010678 [Monosporascus sp. CRB-8-3]|nr:hypothetical protein DL769_010678 [Monosporascus sp. CRB-8-3]